MTGLPLCVIGAGSIGMRHINCAMESAAVQLTAVVEPHGPTRDDLAARGLPVVATLDAVPHETRAAIIATPTPDHATTAMACLARGWAVLVEKPLTETRDEAEALCAMAEAKGLPLLTGYHRRCHPFVAEARARIAGLGQMVAVQGLWSLRKHDSYYEPEWRRSAGAGPILTNLSHEIDLLHLLAGPIVEVTAMASSAARGFGIEDTAALSFRFESGALGSFLLSDAGASPWAFEAATAENPAIAVRGYDPVRFVGTAGAMAFPSLETWRATEGCPPDWRYPLISAPGPVLGRVDGIAAQLERFARIAQGHPDSVPATGRDGLRSMAVLGAVQAAARTGQTQRVA